jgi:hypothetical protein
MSSPLVHDASKMRPAAAVGPKRFSSGLNSRQFGGLRTTLRRPVRVSNTTIGEPSVTCHAT